MVMLTVFLASRSHQSGEDIMMIFVFWVFNILASSAGEPTIGFISPDVVTDIGGDVELTCTCKDATDYPIIWVRLDKTGGNSFPITTGNQVLINNRRFSLDLDDESNTYALSIKNVQPSDAATYQCQVVVDLHNMVTADVMLLVRLPPFMTDKGSPNSVTGVIGNSVTMECIAEGYPSPRITWTRKDGRILFTGKTAIATQRLVIPKLRKEDRGVYVCTASNGLGDDQSRTIDLSVEFSPEIVLPSPKVAQAMGYDVTLSCTVKAFPPPAIKWFRKQEEIKNSDQHIVTHFASQNEVISSTVKLSGLSESMFGNYSCEASNRHGEANATMELYESRIPICPPVCGEFDIMSGSDTHIKIGMTWIVTCFINYLIK